MQRTTLTALVATTAALCAAASAAAVPGGLPYTGELLTPAGSPYTGTLDLTATLYPQEQGGTPLWGPKTFTGVDVVNGTFVVVLDDDTTPIAAALEGTDDAWLAFSVKPDGEADWLPLEGRQQLLSLAYAHEAGNAAQLGGTPAAEFLTATEADTDFPRRDELASIATTGEYADLAGKPDLAGYALTADLAGVCFSGSYQDLAGEPDLSVFVTLDALATVATSGSYGDLANRPDLAVYALAGDLALVAKTGQYADLLGKPDLGAYALVAALDQVALSGDYFDLVNAPDPDALVWRNGSRALTGDLDAGGHALMNAAMHPSDTAPEGPVVGQIWFDTKAQSLKAYAESGWQSTGGGAVVLPPDGLSAVSNGTLTNVFGAGGASLDVPVEIPDNYPPGVTASLTITDSGTLRSISVHVAISHDDASELKITLTSPDGLQFTLHDGGVGTAGGLDATWPPQALPGGDLASLLGTSPNGTWTLSVADAVYSGGAPGTVSGSIAAFQLNYEILRDNAVEISGALTADSLLVDGHDIIGELAALRAELDQLRPLLGDAWCADNCGPRTFGGGCRSPVCDGEDSRCVAGASLPERTPCRDGVCVDGECVLSCGDLLAPCPLAFSCSALSYCLNSANEAWIPAGQFWMGCNSVTDGACAAHESAQHKVTLSAYAIDVTEVTAQQYKDCVTAGACTPGSGDILSTYNVAGKETHPINRTTWTQASTYCSWTGKPAGQQRLCTEAEWERAARGGCETVSGDCQAGMRKYPWGSANPSCSLANFGLTCALTSTAPVGSRPTGVSPYGLQDMAGNVSEWVGDSYAASYPGDSVVDPTGPGSGPYKVKRGGFFNSPADNVRASWRDKGLPDGPSGTDGGFRCCRSLQ